MEGTVVIGNNLDKSYQQYIEQRKITKLISDDRGQ